MSLFKLIGLLLFSSLLAGCASITSSELQSISISTASKDGSKVLAAKCSLRNDKGNWSTETPAVVSVHKSSADLLVECKKEGVDDGDIRAISRASAGLYGNIIFGGVIGAVIDHSKGTGYDYPDNLSVIMGDSIIVDASTGQIVQPISTAKSQNVGNNTIAKIDSPSESTETRIVDSCSSCIGYPNCPYLDNGDGTITDKRNNKTWMRCSYGQQWDGNTCTGTAHQITAPDAIAIGRKTYVANKTKWRLPYKSEFSKLLTSSCNPMINTEVFPNTPLGEYAAFDFTQNDPSARYFNLRTGENYRPVQLNPGIEKSYVRFIHD